MSSYHGLTELIQSGRGFVGLYNIKSKPTVSGRPRFRFDLSCGENDESRNKYPIWLHCVAYDELALTLANLDDPIKPGTWIKFRGYAKRGLVFGTDGKPVMQDGKPMIVESTILLDAEVLQRDQRQERLIPDLSL